MPSVSDDPQQRIRDLDREAHQERRRSESPAHMIQSLSLDTERHRRSSLSISENITLNAMVESEPELRKIFK